MYLVDPSDLIKELGFDDMSDIRNAVEGALAGATSKLGSLLGTSLEANDYEDVFFVPRPSVDQGVHRLTRLRLRAAFVQKESVVVEVGSTPAFTGELFPVDVSGITVNEEKGVVSILGPRLINRYVRVVYSAGFAEPETGQLVEKAPSWMREAAKAQARIVLANAAVLTEANIEMNVDDLSQQRDQFLAQHIRYVPNSYLPV